ncbi:MAG: integration host factor subunit beta [Treponema sp.]|jgi:integration host factor subunit beta|nr:integration host factor subunit beta [Treponema sp.]
MSREEKVSKRSIVDWIAKRSKLSTTELSPTEVKLVLDLFFEAVRKLLTTGLAIELRGFGTFEVRTRKGKQKARNPKTGEEVSIKPHRVAVFKPGKNLKASVWNINSNVSDS